MRSALTGALGGLLFGFDTAVIAGTTHALTAHFDLTPFQLGFTVSIALWGTVIGAISAGEIGQRFGSRATLRFMAVLYVVSSIGCAFAWGWPLFLAARFLGGLGIGGSFGITGSRWLRGPERACNWLRFANEADGERV